MTTPKDKAKELLNKFRDENLMFIKEILDSAKEDATICVNEIIKACEYNNVESWNTDWWNKVKKEINIFKSF